MSAANDPTIRRFAVVTVLLEIQLWFPVWLIFLTDRGISLTTAVLADGMFRIVVVVLELPLGVLCDRIGRLRSLRLLAGLTAVTFTAMAGVNTAWQLFAAWALWGALWALMSGTISAYLYELVREQDLLASRLELFGHVRALGYGAVLISHLTAGVLYQLHPSAPFLVTAGCGAAAYVVAGRLPMVGMSRTSATLRSVLRDLRIAWADGSLRRAALLLGLLLVYGWSVRILFQPLALSLGISTTATGAMYFGFSLASVGGALTVARTVNVWSVRLQVVFGFVALWLATIGSALWPTLAPWVFVPVIGFAYYLSWTVLEVAVNDRTNDVVRATVMSAVSAAGGVLVAVARPGLGAVADRTTVEGAFAVWAVVGVFVVATVVVVARNRLRSRGSR